MKPVPTTYWTATNMEKVARQLFAAADHMDTVDGGEMINWIRGWFKSPTIRETMMLDLLHAEHDKMRIHKEMEMDRVTLQFKNDTLTMLSQRIERLTKAIEAGNEP